MTTTGAGKKEFIPRLIFWEVNKGCNLRCVHCRATATELSSPNDLSNPRALDIISQIAGFCSPILVLSGGEPLYRPDIFQLARVATEKGIRVALATNGTLAAGASVFASATAGALTSTAGAGLQVLNAKSDTATGTPAANQAVIEINRPFMQGQIT